MVSFQSIIFPLNSFWFDAIAPVSQQVCLRRVLKEDYVSMDNSWPCKQLDDKRIIQVYN